MNNFNKFQHELKIKWLCWPVTGTEGKITSAYDKKNTRKNVVSAVNIIKVTISFILKYSFFKDILFYLISMKKRQSKSNQ